MTIEPRFYQKECANQVFRKICEGKRKITVLVPAGSGKTVIAALIAEKVCTSYQKALIVTEHRVIEKACNDKLDQLELPFLESITIDKLITKNISADLYILYSLKPSSRKRVSEYLGCSNSAIIVSFGEPNWTKQPEKTDFIYKSENMVVELEIHKNKESLCHLAEYYKMMGNVLPFVYSTESIIDIRDIMVANPEEKKVLTEKIKNDRNELAHEIIQLSEAVSKNNDSELLGIITKQKRKLDYYEQLLMSCGIPKDVLEEEFEKIESLREELKEDFYTSEGVINETVISQFETAVADSIVRITRRILTLENEDRYEDILKELVSKDVWDNKLSEASKSYLITAKMNYESMIQMENREELEFSGVCLLVTKALDVEIARRLYVLYLEYLEDRFPFPQKIEKWPKSMLDKEKTDILEAKDFTLGSVAYVVGVDKEGNIKNSYVYRLFTDYARQELYKSNLNESLREMKIKNIVKYVEKIREEYRNPSAHRERIDLITAEECMDYMLETYKKLKEILEDMRR